MRKNVKNKLAKIFDLLNAYYGNLGWWPARTRFEVIVGAILTQNTAWSNVEKAICELKRKRCMTPEKILNAKPGVLSKLIKSSGYHRLKTERLKNICRFLKKESTNRLKKDSICVLREKLLCVKGVGPETADSILLYAFDKPVFVVDAYTKRIFSRHDLIDENADYNHVQSLVHSNLNLSTKKLNQFHACIVETAKRFCKKSKVLCSGCPLGCLSKKI